MMAQGVQRVLVVGAGTMGAGIAEVCAKAGAQTELTDLTPAQLDRARSAIRASLDRAVEKGKLDADEAKAVKARLTFTTEMTAAGRDLIIEAVPETMSLKKDVFRALAADNAEGILASNTSSLSLTEIAAATPNPERVVGLHFFNPPPVMPLLEIVRAEQTSQDVLQSMKTWAIAAGKSPIIVRDVPGFATSRLGIILGMEAIRMLETGVGTVEAIDRAMELGYRHPMGPLKLTDLVGLDVRLSIAEHLTHELGPQFTPPPLLRRLVRAGRLGKKTGEGFYRWTEEGPQPTGREGL